MSGEVQGCTSDNDEAHVTSAGNHGDAIFGHHLNIGSLIGLFCEDLQEQIESRIYFYKNSKLVTMFSTITSSAV